MREVRMRHRSLLPNVSVEPWCQRSALLSKACADAKKAVLIFSVFFFLLRRTVYNIKVKTFSEPTVKTYSAAS